MIELIKQLNSIGWFQVLLTLALIITLIPTAKEKYEKLLQSLNLKSTKEIHESEQEEKIDSLYTELKNFQKNTFNRESEWHQQSIDIRNGLEVNQEHLLESINEVSKTLEGLKADVLSEKIERMRWRILDCATSLASGQTVGIEQLNNVLKVYDDYEKIITENDLSNGQVEESIKYIRTRYQELYY